MMILIITVTSLPTVSNIPRKGCAVDDLNKFYLKSMLCNGHGRRGGRDCTRWSLVASIAYSIYNIYNKLTTHRPHKLEDLQYDLTLPCALAFACPLLRVSRSLPQYRSSTIAASLSNQGHSLVSPQIRIGSTVNSRPLAFKALPFVPLFDSLS